MVKASLHYFVRRLQLRCEFASSFRILVLLLSFSSLAYASNESRLQIIRERGYLTCGVAKPIAGFLDYDSRSQPFGFEVDFCRAIAAAIFDSADRVAYMPADTIEDFLANDDIDVVARRLTWTLRREVENRISFSPIIFYDGATLLLQRQSGTHELGGLSGQTICSHLGSKSEYALRKYYSSRSIPITIAPAPTLALAAAAFMNDKCVALAGDLSEIAAIRAESPNAEKYSILPGYFSKEPLSLLMRSRDRDFERVVRWTIFALIEAEELGITSSNIPNETQLLNRESAALLGVDAGNGRSLGLTEMWARNIIHAVGNYGEIYERNLGMTTRVAIPRGLNALWSQGGLMYAPPLW